jgi:hypothetical protein
VLSKVQVPLQTGGNTTATTTATPATATATPTATGVPNNYPDGSTLFQTSIQVYQLIASAHVKLITIAEKPNIEKLSIVGTGDASCSGPAMHLSVTATDALEGTAQISKVSASFAQKGAKTEIKNKATKNKWKKVNGDNVTVDGFPFPIQNPLVCPNVTQTGTGSTSTISDTFKDVFTKGPATFQKKPSWIVDLTDVRTDTSTGDTLNIPVELVIDQKHFFPYKIIQTINDTVDGIVITEEQDTSKIGEKVKLPYYKIGSS